MKRCAVEGQLGALADGNQPRLRCEGQHLGVDERVVKDDLGLLEQPVGAHGQQVGRAGAGADQMDPDLGRGHATRSVAAGRTCRRKAGSGWSPAPW
jgi:hypothetical protein